MKASGPPEAFFVYINVTSVLIFHIVNNVLYEKLLTLHQLSDLFNNLPFDFWIVDSSRCYIYQNKFSLENWGDVLGKSIDELNVEESIKKIWHQQLNRVFAGEIINNEYLDDHSRRWFKTIISPVGKDNQISAVAGVTIDITETKQNQTDLEEKTKDLESMNRVLQVMVRESEENAMRQEQKIIGRIRKQTMPLLSLLKSRHAEEEESSALIDAVITSLPVSEINNLESLKNYLSPTEVQIVSLIEQEKTSKEIAAMLNIAKSTVDTHRDNIRKKLSLKQKGLSLKSFIRSELQKITT